MFKEVNRFAGWGTRRPTCEDVSVMRVIQPQSHLEERRGLEHPSFKLLQGDGRIQELPFLLIGEMRVYELLWVGEEIEIIEPSGGGATDGDSRSEKNLLLVSSHMIINTRLLKPFHKTFLFHIDSSCSPAGVQEEPLTSQKHGVPQMIGFHILEALALSVPDALTMARHLLALDAHLSVNTANGERSRVASLN